MVKIDTHVKYTQINTLMKKFSKKNIKKWVFAPGCTEAWVHPGVKNQNPFWYWLCCTMTHKFGNGPMC